MALCALSACGGTLRVPESDPISETACAVETPPFTTGDSAIIRFHVIGSTGVQCALGIVAETLRPWPLVSRDPWTVHLTVLPTHAVARSLSSEAARDAVDGASTFMATDDLDLIAYAASRAELEVAPLSWDRTYLRLSPARTSTLGTDAGPDAVRADARLAEPPACDSVVPGADAVTAPATSMRVVYDTADRVARALAERTVALAQRADVTAVGLRGADFDAALQRGDHLAYIVALPRSSYCDALVALSGRAPWLAAGSAVPVIDTRAHAIMPRAQRP